MSGQARTKILIADDESTIRDFLRDALSEQGYELCFARDGQEALEMAAAQQPDLILLDIVLPKVFGWDVCERLRKNPATASIKVIMLSALAQDSHRRKAFSAGADSHLTKPVPLHELYGTIAALVVPRTGTA